MENLPKLNDVERLSERVVRVMGQNPSPYTLQGTNSYVIGTGASRILLDTASPTQHTLENNGTRRYMENLQQFLAGENAKIGEILVSHRHFDHVGAVGDLLQNAEVVAQASSIRCSKYESSRQNEYTTPISWHYIVDNEQFCTDGVTLSAIYTPGHTDDHVAYILEEENAIFTGDTILGHGPTIAEHLDRYIETLQRLKALNNTRHFSRIYPAHGQIIDGEEAVSQKIEEYLKHRLERVEQVRQSVANAVLDNATVDYLFEKVYPSVTGMLKHGAMNNLRQSLQLLAARGEIEPVEAALPDGTNVTQWRPKQPAGSTVQSKLSEEHQTM